MKKPQTTWTGFLFSAPYFTSAIMSAMVDEDLPEYSDLIRAVIYYDIFDGEVCNGGVMQYFFNQALYLPDFEAAADIVSRHPDLADGAAFMKEAHAAWDSVKDKVIAARQADEWPANLFSDSHFENLENRFFDVNQAIRLKIYAAICRAPEDYLDILPDAKDHQLRFENGFPIGPNIVTSSRETATVWFTPDRMHIEVDSAGFFKPDDRSRTWLDLHTGASGSRTFTDGKLASHSTEQALWTKHGLSESYTPNGAPEFTSLYLDGKQLLLRFDDGAPLTDKKALRALLKASRDLND